MLLAGQETGSWRRRLIVGPQWLQLLIPVGAFMFSVLAFAVVERIKQQRPWTIYALLASLGLALFTLGWVVRYDFAKGCRWID